MYRVSSMTFILIGLVGLQTTRICHPIPYGIEGPHHSLVLGEDDSGPYSMTACKPVTPSHIFVSLMMSESTPSQ